MYVCVCNVGTVYNSGRASVNVDTVIELANTCTAPYFCCNLQVPERHFTVNHRALHTHTCPFNGPLSGSTWVSRYQKGKTNQDFTGARDSEWQWHQLGHMQVCTSLQTDNHTSTQPLMFLQAGCPSCHPTNSVKALKEYLTTILP